MNDYARSWLELIYIRDNFYLTALLLVAVTYFWYRYLRTKIRNLFAMAMLGAVLLVGAAWWWALLF